MRRSCRILVFSIFAILCASCKQSSLDTQQRDREKTSVQSTASKPSERPAAWAQPIEGKPGLPNFHKLGDNLYRGAQPEGNGFEELKKMGIKTVINLRTLHSEKEQCEKIGMDYVQIRCQAWEGEDDETVDFLKIVTDPSRGPVFIHCQHGADRTGTMCAVYRIVVQGWSKEDAVKEMTEGGYGFHTVWENLIQYLEKLNVDAIRKEAGLENSKT